MAEGNGGGMSPGERLRRIEERFDKFDARLERIEEHFEDRVTRHRERNAAQIKELAQFVMDDFGERVTKLEKQDVADAAVKGYRKWFVGAFIGMAGLIVTVLVLLIQLMGRV